MALNWAKSRRLRLLQQLLCLAFVSWVICSVSASTTVVDGTNPIRSNPSAAFFGPTNTLAYWQIPPGGSPRKLLVILEGRKNFPSWFWDRSSVCPICIGKPEHRQIVDDALSNNYAVLIPTSIATEGDWVPWPPNNFDLVNVVSVINEWRRLFGFENLPMVGLGASSGGHGLSTLGLLPGFFESISLMVSVGYEHAWEEATSDYPPTLFIHMPKDAATAKSITATMKKLTAKNIVVAEERWYEHPLSIEFFTGIIHGMRAETAADIIRSLRADGFLAAHENDPNAGMMLNSDAMRFDWHDRIFRWNILPQDPVEPDNVMYEEDIMEELRTAYAIHGTFSRKDKEMFAWFDGGHQNSQNALVESA